MSNLIFTRESVADFIETIGSCPIRNDTIRGLATTLLAEMDKPKVWDGAPENAVIAQVHFYKAAKTYATPSATPMVYTRERPKSRAREIAEEERKRALCEAKAIIDIADYVEAGILRREVELRGES